MKRSLAYVSTIVLAGFTLSAHGKVAKELAQRSMALYKSGSSHLEMAQTLEQMSLNSLAAAEYVEAGQAGLPGLFTLADRIGDEGLLDYVLTKTSALNLPLTKSQDFIFRNGERSFNKKQYAQSAQILAGVQSADRRYFKARYLTAVALMNTAKSDEAMKILTALYAETRGAAESDYSKTLTTAALARLHYKLGNWEKSLEYYRMVPKDSDLWSDVLVEMSWAQFRLGDIREVLGSLGSLHSPYYEDRFVMESVLLRSFVYLFICSLDEMEKTLDLFARMYVPLKDGLNRVLAQTSLYSDLLKQVEQNKLPRQIRATLAGDPEFKRAFQRVENLRQDQERIVAMNDEWRNSPLGQSAAGFAAKRLKEAEKLAGMKARAHLEGKQKEIERLFRQYDFAKYEMIAATKQRIKQSDSDLPDPKTAVEGLNRAYFLAHGIEYYTFRGEYWLDEIGNSHFIGQNRCANK
jgi:hypothetical protein